MNKNHNIEMNHIIYQVEGNIVSDMDGEKVMLSIRKGKYYNLGDIGGEIWEQLKEPILVKDLMEVLKEKYDVQEIDYERQVFAFLNHLREEELIQISK